MHRLAIIAVLIAADSAAQSQQPSFQTQTDLVNILVTVRDQHNHPIATLNKSSFRVFEDGKPQEIKYFAQDSSAPLTIGVLVDSSFAQGDVLGAEREAARRFFSTAIREKDLAFLINFDTEVTLLADLTKDQATLQRSLLMLRPGRVYPDGPLAELNASRTHLYDAIYLAAEKLKEEAGHKAIVLLASGDDRGSKVKVEEAIVAAQKADAAVYSIRYVYADSYWPNSSGLTQQTVLRKIAEGTGGRTLSPATPESLINAVREIAEELRSQYSIGFAPAKLDGSFHKVEVKVNQHGLRAQCRKGYFADK